MAQTIAAELVWNGAQFTNRLHVSVEGDRITSVGAPTGPADLRLPGMALIPGFVNAHSHAFQRGLRGQGETFPQGKGSFWTWREAMYTLVSELSWKQFRSICVDAFSEMRASGITSVGEFHYFHHAKAEDYALDRVVLEAAREVGIRIVLLNAYYNTGAIGEPLTGAQLRFRSADTRTFLRQMDSLGSDLHATQTLGFVVHSIRAANKIDLAEIHRESKRRGAVFHMHIEEQPLEIEQCKKAYGLRPMQVVLNSAEVDDKTTFVHCTHTDPADMMMVRTCGGRVCLCPLTEANLGDGLADIPNIGAVSLGSDSNNRISMLEEMRWTEYGQRLKTLRRGIHPDPAMLMRHATVEGAASLGIPAGAIAPGHFADFALIDLDSPALRHTTPETLLPALIYGCGNEVIAGTCVGGEWSLRDRPQS